MTESMKSKLFQIFAWIVWFVFFLNAIKYLTAPFISPATAAKSDVWTNYATFFLIFFSLLEAGLTFVIRHFAIMKPYKKGTYNPRVRFLRFFAIGILLWLMSNSIVCYGTLTYYMLGTLWQHYFFSTLGLALLIFHTPRLGPFNEK